MTKIACLFLCTLFLAQSAYSVTVGPRPPEKKSLKEATISRADLPKRMDIPPMRVAVPVLEANLDEFSDKNDAKMVWPEIRKTEAIRSATKIRDSLIALNQFESVVVFPNTEISADLFVLGEIRKSTGEILTIRWQLVDATGKVWIPNRKGTKDITHRVPLGWHQRFGGPGKDPFQKVYDEIAAEVLDVLKRKAASHKKVAASNQRRIKSGQSPRLSELEGIVGVREMVVAKYFAPELYGDAITEKNSGKTDSRLTLEYLPNRDDPNWVRVQSFVLRDKEFVGLMNSRYNTFRETIDPVYEEWMRDIYALSREIRILNRRANIEKVLGAVITVGAVAAAAKAGDTGVRDRILTAGGLAGAGLLVSGFMKGHKRKNQVQTFNEMANSYHDSLGPTRLEFEGETVELKGTATEQFNQWRDLLRDLYARENSNATAIVLPEDQQASANP